MVDSEVDQCQQSRLKKGKAKVRDEINITVKKMDRDLDHENKSGEKLTDEEEENLGKDPAPRSKNESKNKVVAGNKRS